MSSRSLCRVATLVGLLLASNIEAEPAALRNRWLEVGFQSRDGQFAEFTDRKAQWNHVVATTNNFGLWEMEVAVSGKKLTVHPGEAGDFQLRHLSESRARLDWSGFNISGLQNLTVSAEIALEPQSASSRWDFEVSDTPGVRIERIHYPRVPGIRPQANERLAAPLWMGQLCREPRKLLAGSKPNRLEWDYPGLTSLQCLAFYQEQGPGMYLACNDTNGYRKSFIFRGDTLGQIICECQHLPEHREGERYRLPYQVVLGTFVGDWFTAAERYRSWATNQFWAGQSRLTQNVSPAWVTNTALWVWNRGRSPEVLAPAVALQQELGLPVSVFWHWWHGCAYDTGFPEYLPPREGADAFTQALAEAKSTQLHAIVYMNQRLWGMTTRSWDAEEASKFAVKGSDGTIHPEVYNTFTKLPCASMCISTPFWRNKYASLADTAFRQLGVDGIYMDQACSSLACFDPRHGHPIGGGRYWVEGFRQLSTDLRERTRGTTPDGTGRPRDPIALAGEGCSEGWLPYLDLMLSLQVSKERYAAPNDGWEPIPFFQAVYHPYSVLYGNYSSLTFPPYDDLWPAEFAPKEKLKLLDRKFSQQFMLEQARSWLWGQQPALANFLPNQLVERREEIDYVLKLARLRQHHLKYLLHGTFLRPPQWNTTPMRLPLSRLSIYAGQQGSVTEFEGSSQTVLAAAWLANDRNLAVFLANLADSPQTVPLTLARPDYPLPARGAVFDATQSIRKQLGRFSGHHFNSTITIPAKDFRVIELGR